MLAVLWAIWLHRNEVLLRGWTVSVNRVIHGIGDSWYPGSIVASREVE